MHQNTELFNMIPKIPNEKRKKRSILITDTTYDQFGEFTNEIPHIAKNQLIELALIDFMKRYR